MDREQVGVAQPGAFRTFVGNLPAVALLATGYFVFFSDLWGVLAPGKIAVAAVLVLGASLSVDLRVGATRRARAGRRCAAGGRAAAAEARWPEWRRCAAGDWTAAVMRAREAIRGMAHLSGGLSEEQGSGVRGRFSELYEIGARAAAALGGLGDVSFFLESGRAGALLESLQGRDALEAAALPESLRVAEAEARRKEALAVAACRRSVDGGDLARIRELRARMHTAQEGVHEVVERIQREAKAAASVLYPEADGLEQIERRLGPGEAFVSYGLFPTAPMALVVRARGTRLVRLPPLAGIEAAVAALAADRPDSETAEPLAALRSAVVGPLGLDEDVETVLVSPMGVLSYVPFPALFDGLDVAYVPSGTTHGVLRRDAEQTGEGVLALGDPDYETSVDEHALAVVRGGLRLVPLPGTREEVRAVGTHVLLGAQASEPGLLEALAARPRWRAAHFACHGLVDPERPAFCSLALSATEASDGFLTAIEVFRMRIPADLVVLSACETGKGRIVQGEGIVGLARAFMYAGAPRVICSLWKVDDEATRALMVKFYELWNPRAKPGDPAPGRVGPGSSGGLGAAAALRQAQAFVRGHDRWRHPYFWAAWVLWGLPD